MTSLGQLTNALGVVRNENTLALANANFDFSLFRFDAPVEYQALGENISARRRQEAERGSQHRTARRLGALFEGVLPQIPGLSRAYGRRVSEVSQSLKQDPKANASGGPFSDLMGADGTTIWAAATSGPNAIPILLLGCMLARIWSGPEATSLWVELVDHRRKEIEESCTGTSSSHYVLLQAARQEITRSNLADWDASTRAWLQTADEVKQLQQTQFMLIINNLQLPVSNNMSVYQSVIESAKIALLSMENLLNGAAQRVQNGAFLLGLSTWHIYPDMVVHGSTTKSIKQDDRLVPEGGIITLGLQGDAEFNQGIYWSLPLAHLHFYGDPIHSSRSTAVDASRVFPHQLVYIALGAVFSRWFDTSRDTPRGLQWLHELSDFFDRAATLAERNHAKTPEPNLSDIFDSWELRAEKAREERSEYERLQQLLHQSGWMRMLMSTAVAISQLSKSDREKANKLIALGYRRYTNMLIDTSPYQPPYFGLLKPENLFSLLKTDEDGISVLRSLAKREGLTGSQHIIRYEHIGSNKVSFIEYATVDPLPPENASTLSQLYPPITEQQNYRHKRWIALTWNYDGTDENHLEENSLLKRLKAKKYACCRCGDNCSSACLCKAFSDGCLDECSCHGKRGTCTVSGPAADELEGRAASIRSLGEDCIKERPRSFLDFCRKRMRLDSTGARRYIKISHQKPNIDSYRYQQSVSIRNISDEFYDDMKDFYRKMWGPGKSHADMIWHLRNGPWFEEDLTDTAPACLNFRSGDPRTAALYFVSKVPSREMAEIKSKSLTEEELQRLLRADAIVALDLEQYLARLRKSKQGYDNSVVSLKALASMMTVYEHLPGATVALRAAAQPLHDSSYIREHLKVDLQHWEHLDTTIRPDPWLYKLDLASTFSCIALYEFGVHDINPGFLKDVFAMSSRNSIFVAAPLLDDPGCAGKDNEIRRVVGNIGRAGIALMIPPQAPRIRSAETDNWEQLNHAPFDGKPADSFQNTSLHLSFTQYTLPINTGTHGAQDTETFLIESPISIHDRERWVADVDVLGLFQSKDFHRYQRDCLHSPGEKGHSDLVAIDNWEEMLDREKIESVVRAYQNPQARLATAIISARQGHYTVVVSGETCWPCIEKKFKQRPTFIQ